MSHAKCPCGQMDRYTKWIDGATENIFRATWLRADAVLQDLEIGRPRWRGEESRAGSSEEDSEQTPRGGLHRALGWGERGCWWAKTLGK